MATTVPVPTYSALVSGFIPGVLFGSFILFAHQRTLAPLYGSYPASYLLYTISYGAALISAVQPFTLSGGKRWWCGAVVLSLAPNATYWVAIWTSRQRWPVLGPAITHAIVLVPSIFLFTSFVIESSKATPLAVRLPLRNRLLVAGVGHFIASSLARYAWPSLTHLNGISDSQIYLALAAISFSAFIVGLDFPSSAATSKSKKKHKDSNHPLSPAQIKTALLVCFAAFWWTIYPQLANPVLPHPLEETYTHPTGKVQIHSAVQSVTGLIVVGETLPPLDGEESTMHSARYLRADHSILGGVWVRDKVHTLDDDDAPVVDSYGTPLGDTFYSTFVLQEAARLVNSTEVGRTGAWKNALTIGLGTGFSASAFSRHGLSTTIVEIDPAVYDAARTWFGLADPGPDNVFLEDARAWTEKRLRKVEAGLEKDLYDIVVHDCFSGGGVPEHIFTTEFWADLKRIMQPEGVLVVNFAGEVKSESSKLILHTLEQHFNHCRAFHDMMDTLKESEYDTEFLNIVLFCTDSAGPLTFRKPKRSDYLGSPLRKFMFEGLKKREIDLDAVRVQDPEEAKKYILRDKGNRLGELQRKQALHHWELMRTVLPDLYWETY